LAALIALVTLAVFWPVTHHQFIRYDDQLYLTANPHVQAGLRRAGLVWAFGHLTGEGTYWHPLTWLSHMLDCQMFGLKPAGHHLVNLLIHVANAVLLMVVLNRMTGALWKSALVAALFALHPLQVDTIAWAAERKNVLSAFFLMLTLLAYARYARRPRWPAGLVVALWFALGLMCKPSLVALPLGLLVLDCWPLGRWGRPDASAKRRIALLFLEKTPLLLLSVGSSLITVVAHQKLSLLISPERFSFGSRLSNAAVSYLRYLGKVVWPVDLAVFYPYPYASAWPVWEVAAAMLLLAGISVLALGCARTRPYILSGWLWFLVLLLPVIGIVQAGIQSMADRFMYVPITGVLFGAVWTAGDLWDRWAVTRRGLVAAAAAVLAGCAATSWVQLGYWQNDLTLFEHATKVTEDNAVAHHNLAAALAAQGNDTEAIAHYQATPRIWPDVAGAHISLGLLLDRKEKYAEAMEHYSAAVKYEPANPEAHYQLAMALSKQGQGAAAVEQLREAARLKPRFGAAHYQLGVVLSERGQIEEAIQHYQEAIRLKADWLEALNNLAWLLATEPDDKLRNGTEAVRLATHAVELTKTNNPGALDTLAAAYAEAHRFADAVRTAQLAEGLALSAAQKDMAVQIHSRLELYQGRQPARE
jgi:tetratricopeptide (TPR) repeat protein